MVEPIDVQFGMLSQLGPWNHVLDGVHINATWRIRLNRPCMQALCQVTLTSCYVLLLFASCLNNCAYCWNDDDDGYKFRCVCLCGVRYQLCLQLQANIVSGK